MVQSRLSVGKLDPSLLKRLIFKCLGTADPRVMLGPNIGEDATVIDFGDRALVVHSDPITGAVENVGWLAVNVCTNDIATRGIRPLWILTVLLLPENFTIGQLKSITTQIDQAAKQLGVAVVGGHSEVTSGINRPIIITTAIGETHNKRFVRTSGAKKGDALILTKGAAVEGTAILAHELEDFLQTQLDNKTIERAKQFIKMTSVVKDALTAIETCDDHVHAMHDATEGGVTGGLQEIAWASNKGLIAHENKIPIYAETRAVCEALDIDPLRTISGGTLIISVETEKAEKIVASLKQKDIQASVIGKVLDKKEGAYILRKDGTKFDLSKPIKEELWRAMEKRL